MDMSRESRSPTPTSNASSPAGSPSAAGSSGAPHEQGADRGRSIPAGPSSNSPAGSATAAEIMESSDAKKKRTRTLTTPYQSAVLHQLLAESRFPSTQVREDVGSKIGLSARKVQIWFQNQRQKAKRLAHQPPPTPASHYGPYTNTQAASSTTSTATTRTATLALDAGMGGAVAGMMFSSSGFFGGPRTAPKKSRGLPTLPENDAAPVASASSLPSMHGPYRSASQTRGLSRSASRMSTVSSNSSWSQQPSEFDLGRPRTIDDDRRSTTSSGLGAGYSVTSFSSAPASAPASASYARSSLTHGSAGRPSTSSSVGHLAKVDLASLSLGRDSPYSHQSPIELPPLTFGGNSPPSTGAFSGSRISLPPIKLDPTATWDNTSPYVQRPSFSGSLPSATPRSAGGSAHDLHTNTWSDARPELSTRSSQRWDPVRAAVAERERERGTPAQSGDGMMDVDMDSSSPPRAQVLTGPASHAFGSDRS